MTTVVPERDPLSTLLIARHARQYHNGFILDRASKAGFVVYA